jgi:hypothetical protein
MNFIVSVYYGRSFFRALRFFQINTPDSIAHPILTERRGIRKRKTGVLAIPSSVDVAIVVFSTALSASVLATESTSGSSIGIDVDVGIRVGEGVFVGVIVGVHVNVGVLDGTGDGVFVGPVIAIIVSCDHVGAPQLEVYLPTLNIYSPGPE